MRLRLALPLVVLCMLLPACSANDDTIGCDVVAGQNDINPLDRSEIRDGGNLRLSLTGFPENFNALNVDGNNAEIAKILWAIMPRAYSVDATAALTINTDYFTDIALTNENPQQVTYTINPKAVWSDGTPITWEDLQSQGAALSGATEGYRFATTNGFDRVEKIERGVDDRQAIITFKQHYAEWRGQFSGNAMLYPKAVTATPEAFNTSLLNDIPLTAGPFVVKNIDKTQNRITLGRNPLWWGATPKLDSITFIVLEDSALVQSLQNDEIDAADLRTVDDLRGTQDVSGLEVRCALENEFTHITFNGAPGSILNDPKLRVAISKGINRQEVADSVHHGIVEDPTLLNNHIFLEGQVGYEDNAQPIAFDPEQARTELDELGWKLVGDVREKDGRQLEIRNVMYKSDYWQQVSSIVQQDLADIGVRLIIDPFPGEGFFPDVVIPGRFDLANFRWVGDAFPLASLPQIYAYNPDDLQSNFGRIGSPEINALIEQAIAELDPVKANELANKVDRLVFEEGFSIPLVQSPGNVGIRASVANFGAPGLASYDYTAIGFTK